MIIENKTPYPDAEVAKIVRSAAAASPHGPKPQLVVVRYRTLPADTRLGFTPYDHRYPMELWVEPPDRYPQPGARSWREELTLSTLHEMNHYRHKDCHGQRCEAAAENYAQKERRRLRAWR